jgi:hypothetical protein
MEPKQPNVVVTAVKGSPWTVEQLVKKLLEFYGAKNSCSYIQGPPLTLVHVELDPVNTRIQFRLIFKAIPVNRPWKPIGLWEVEAPTLSWQSAHRWRQGCQSYASAIIYSPGRFLVLISVRDWVDPRVLVRLEGLSKLKKFTPSGLDPATFRFVA